MKTNSTQRLEVLHTRKEIEITVSRLAEEITWDYSGRNPLFIGVLKGALIFMSDRRRDTSPVSVVSYK